jgi:mRNA interferase MazF
MQTPKEPKAGEVWYVNFHPQVGREQGGLRPALVISNNEFNSVRNDLYIVAPITGTDRGWPHHLGIDPPEGGLTRRSVIMCDQQKSQSVERFVRMSGVVTAETLENAQAIVGEFIDRDRHFD